MIYTSVLLPIPEDNSRYETYKTKHEAIYVKYRVRSYRDGGKIKHERISIGRLVNVPEMPGKKFFNPNERYYSFFKITPPVSATFSKPGRPPKEKKETKERKGKESISLGYVLACYTLAKEIKLDTILENNFQHDFYKKIMAGSAFMAAGAPGGLSSIEYFTNKHMCFTDCVITSQGLSTLYNEITETTTNGFFTDWIKEVCISDCVCYDVTSISSFSRNLSPLGWGYNRDHEKLPQFNFGMFCTVKNQLPALFVEYNGPVNDFTGLPYALDKASRLGMDFKKSSLTLVMDGGFAVRSTLEDVQLRGCDFIVGAPMHYQHSNVCEEIQKWQSNSEYKDVIITPDESIRYGVIETKFGNVDTNLFMYKSTKLSAKREEALSWEVFTAINDIATADKIKEEKLKEYRDVFDIKPKEGGGYDFELKTEDYFNALEICGSFGLFSTRKDLSAEEVLNIYRGKDCIEKCFGVLKNDILKERVRVKNDESLYGKLFLCFVALILRKALSNKLRSSIKTARTSVDSAIVMLSDIQCIREGDKWFLNKALTKEQKILVEVLGLPINYFLNQRMS